MSEAKPDDGRDAILAATDIVRTYGHGDIAVPVLKGLDLQVRRGEWVACTGRSGSGKSTLVRVPRDLVPIRPDNDLCPAAVACSQGPLIMNKQGSRRPGRRRARLSTGEGP